jgi:hypothetical protein
MEQSIRHGAFPKLELTFDGAAGTQENMEYVVVGAP